MAESDPQSRIVWWSGQQSYDANIPSVLGIFEVGLAVWLYWWLIPAWFDTHLHLVASVCIAPMLLLRSDACIEEALDGFETYWKCTAEFELRTWSDAAFLLAISLAGFTFSYWLTWGCLIGHEGWGLFWRSAVVGWASIGVGGALAGVLFLGLVLVGTGFIALARSNTVTGAGAKSVITFVVSTIIFSCHVIGLLSKALSQRLWSRVASPVHRLVQSAEQLAATGTSPGCLGGHQNCCRGNTPETLFLYLISVPVWTL